MSRPRKERKVECEPNAVYFKPRGIPLTSLTEVVLSVDELECLRLRALCKMSQKEGAEKMGIHQSTFHRTLASAMEHLADALVNAKAIRIDGGPYSIESGKDFLDCKCPRCGHTEKYNKCLSCQILFCPSCKTKLVKVKRT